VTAPPDRLVVGAVIVQHARLLAARRVHPPALAGRWELPGGKVDQGETPEAACVREVREELGCEVRVVRRLPGEQPLNPGFVLWLYETALVDGEPVPSEHDAIRWLGPEELEEVPWLPADLPLLAPLRERLHDGEPLPGGNVGGAVRIGTTVRRPTGPWSPAVHALLGYLDEAGLGRIPRVLGTDARGREVLTWLEGEVPDAEVSCPDDILVDAMRWLADYHGVVRGYQPAGEMRWRNHTPAIAAGEIICHHDVAPYNLAVQERRVVGVFDWDMAGPGQPIDDVAFAAWNFVPLWRDLGIPEAARRLRLLCGSYGAMDPSAVARAVLPRIADSIDRIRAGQRAGDPGMLNLGQVGEPDRTEQSLAALRTRLPGIQRALSES